MTGETRTRLKAAVDARVRELQTSPSAAGEQYGSKRTVCKGCGAELISFSEGCKTCQWRWWRWASRGNLRFEISPAAAQAKVREMRLRGYARNGRAHKARWAA